MIVCEDDWEPRHSMDYLKTNPDKIRVPYIRNHPVDTFIAYCTLQGVSAYAGFGTAGCSITGNDTVSAALLATIPQG
jgi:hypothetical protein